MSPNQCASVLAAAAAVLGARWSLPVVVSTAYLTEAANETGVDVVDLAALVVLDPVDQVDQGALGARVGA